MRSRSRACSHSQSQDGYFLQCFHRSGTLTGRHIENIIKQLHISSSLTELMSSRSLFYSSCFIEIWPHLVSPLLANIIPAQGKISSSCCSEHLSSSQRKRLQCFSLTNHNQIHFSKETDTLRLVFASKNFLLMKKSCDQAVEHMSQSLFP